MIPTFSDLPVDVLLLILADLESARDLRAIALQNRSLSRLVREDGWRVFVRARFPSLSVPNPSEVHHSWQQLADSLTFQSRCWDKRALQFCGLFPARDAAQNRRARRLVNLFQPVVDSYLDPDTEEEVVIWGAGEDIVARYRQKAGPRLPIKVNCARSQGTVNGFRSGIDDIRSLAIIKGQKRHDGSRMMVTGRDSGELALLSAEPDRFGERLVHLRPVNSTVESDGSSQVTGHETINSVDVVKGGTGSLVAAATKSSVLIYEVPRDDATEAFPLTTYSLGTDGLPIAAPLLSRPQLCRATWMGQDGLLALALKGCKDPLRYLELGPTGWHMHSAAKNVNLETQFGIEYKNICPNSLQPVQPSSSSRGTNLLLSAWRDGSCRLQDLRTPSPFDAVYEDNIDPWADMETLLVYGTERFVGGGMNGATIKIFDFRWTKGYYHTFGLPCMDKRPYPEPVQPFLQKPECRGLHRRCNHVRGTPCRWHSLAQNIYYRPNANFFLTRAMQSLSDLTPAVWSLSKPSDISPNFYIGVSGGVLESSLMQGGVRCDPNFGFEDWINSPAPEGYTTTALSSSMMETGDGLLVQANDRAVRVPQILRTGEVTGVVKDKTGRNGKPLDGHYRLDEGIEKPDAETRTFEDRFRGMRI